MPLKVILSLPDGTNLPSALEADTISSKTVYSTDIFEETTQRSTEMWDIYPQRIVSRIPSSWVWVGLVSLLKNGIRRKWSDVSFKIKIYCSFCPQWSLSLSLGLLTLGEATCPVLRQPYRETNMARNKNHINELRSGAPTSWTFRWNGCTDDSFKRPWNEDIHLSHIQLSDPQKLWDNECWLF